MRFQDIHAFTLVDYIKSNSKISKLPNGLFAASIGLDIERCAVTADSKEKAAMRLIAIIMIDQRKLSLLKDTIKMKTINLN